MWSLLHRNQESVLVGTAVTLVMLSLLAHGRSFTDSGKKLDTKEGLPFATAGTDSKTERPSVFASVPSDPAHYAAKWRQIATDFYATNPVKDASAASDVVTASLTDNATPDGVAQNEEATDDSLSVSPVSHRQNVAASDSLSAPEISTPAAESTLENIAPSASSPAFQIRSFRQAAVGKPALAAAFAAGLLAFFCYRSVWPNRVLQKPSIAMSVSAESHEHSTLIRMELPSEWVHIRPPLRQRIKPIVLATSYLAGGLAAWTIVT